MPAIKSQQVRGRTGETEKINQLMATGQNQRKTDNIPECMPKPHELPGSFSCEHLKRTGRRLYSLAREPCSPSPATSPAQQALLPRRPRPYIPELAPLPLSPPPSATASANAFKTTYIFFLKLLGIRQPGHSRMGTRCLLHPALLLGV